MTEAVRRSGDPSGRDHGTPVCRHDAEHAEQRSRLKSLWCFSSRLASKEGVSDLPKPPHDSSAPGGVLSWRKEKTSRAMKTLQRIVEESPGHEEATCSSA
jgi:hypothetical protein